MILVSMMMMMMMMMTEWNRQRRRVPLVGVTGSHEGSLLCSALYIAAMHWIKSRAVFYWNALNKKAQYFTAIHSIYFTALQCFALQSILLQSRQFSESQNLRAQHEANISSIALNYNAIHSSKVMLWKALQAYTPGEEKGFGREKGGRGGSWWNWGNSRN